MNALNDLRQTVSKYLIYILWAHIPLIAVAALFVGGDWIVPTVGAAVFAAVTTVLMKKDSSALAYRYSAAVTYMLHVGLLVYAFSGHPWQIDIHMYFFAALAIVAALCCWKTILAATVTVALHHLILNFVLPSAVFPEGADFMRVVLHAVIVVFESAVLTWLSFKLVSAFDASTQALIDAEAAQTSAHDAKKRAEEAMEEARASAENAQKLQKEAEELHAQQAAAEEHEEARVKQEREAVASEFEASVGAVLQKVTNNTRHLSDQAANLQSIAGNVGDKIGQSSQIAEDMANSVQAVSSATEELSDSIREISSQVNQSNQVAATASERATETAKTMAKMNESAQQISEVVNLINDIAEQTNLLALNATIEAARAGEAGKGFAVVASEVKNLATQTARATEDITTQISGIQQVSEQAASEIEAILNTIQEINATTASVAAAVEEQSVATSEISNSTRNAYEGTVRLKGDVGNIEQFTKQSTEASGSMMSAVNEMVNDTDKVMEEVGVFLRQIRG